MALLLSCILSPKKNGFALNSEGGIVVGLNADSTIDEIIQNLKFINANHDKGTKTGNNL